MSFDIGEISKIENMSGDMGTTIEVTEAEGITHSTDTINWGITLSTKNVQPTGLTLVITQAGGEPTGKLQYGSYYKLEVLSNGVWEVVPYTSQEGVAWTEEAYRGSMENSTEENIIWEHLYGSLTTGTYRITKDFMDFRGVGDYDTQTYSVEFEIQ